MSKVLDRFLEYVTYDTQSDTSSTTYPSTEGQCEFLKMMADRLRQMGLSDVTVDEHHYVMATLEANCDTDTPTIGFLAHVDTSPDMSGKDVKPQVIQYKGGDIPLSFKSGIVLRTSEFPELEGYKGQTLITTDGTTLLGADDKAGVAEIMTAMEYLINHPEIKHGKIRVGFTPDEEIGAGVNHFSVERFGAEYAYTVDGGSVGELEYENFNAASVKLTIKGRNIHPGYAKGKMVNALSIAAEFDGALPLRERPEHTEGYEGFYHLMSIAGKVDAATSEYIIRDHDRETFERRKENIEKLAQQFNDRYGKDVITVAIKDQYYNMAEVVRERMDIVERARLAMERAGVVPNIRPIRGGTDGSRLSFMGLPTPNIFTGAVNIHGRYEYIALESMELAVKTIVEICRVV